jgi:hypothetical protein
MVNFGRYPEVNISIGNIDFSGMIHVSRLRADITTIRAL